MLKQTYKVVFKYGNGKKGKRFIHSVGNDLDIVEFEFLLSHMSSNIEKIISIKECENKYNGGVEHERAWKIDTWKWI